MKNVRRGWDMLTEKDRERYVKDIVAYFHDERNETIGVIAAEGVLDFLLQTTAPGIYNKAIEDAKNLLKKQLDGWDIEFDLLKKQV